MTSKILRADGTTYLSAIKSVVYHESVNADTDLRPGCVSSSYIEVVCYGSQSDAPAVGEALRYYQVTNGTSELIGIFYAKPSITNRGQYSFTAFDSLSKLDVDFSSWLAEHQSDFPMTVYDLIVAACSVANISYSLNNNEISFFQGFSVPAFYVSDITCRQIISYAAELKCNFVKANSTGALIFNWYELVNERISPSSNQTETPLTFTTSESQTYQGYLETSEIDFSTYGHYSDSILKVQYSTSAERKFYARIIYQDGASTSYRSVSSANITSFYYEYMPKFSVPSTAQNLRVKYYFPNEDITFLEIDRVSPSVDSNVPVYFPYKQDGLTYSNYTLNADAVAVHPVGEDEDLAYIYPTSVTSGSILHIRGNLLLAGATEQQMNDLALRIYSGLSFHAYGYGGDYRPFEAKMFPNESPFRAGRIVIITDSQNVTFLSVIMQTVVTDSERMLIATGNEAYEDSVSGVNSQLVQLSANSSTVRKQIGDMNLDTTAQDLTGAVNELKAEIDGIIESNSDYCKMSDGTLICWGTVTNTAQGYATMTFPVAFISVPNVTATPYYSSGGGGLNCRVIVQPTTTGGNIYFRQLTSTAISTETNQQAYYTAIGRWK